MELQDFFALLHPAIAIIVVFPLIGIVVNRALLTRQRRLQVAGGEKSKIPPVVGSEHVAIGSWLSGSVVGVALLGMAYPIFSKMLSNDTLTKEPFRVFFAIAIFLLSIASFTLLFKANFKLWRGIFATFSVAMDDSLCGGYCRPGSIMLVGWFKKCDFNRTQPS